MVPKFEVFKDRNRQWRFRLRAKNGKIIAVSEAYTAKRNAVIGIESVQYCAQKAMILYID